jgi:hypothetical protein
MLDFSTFPYGESNVMSSLEMASEGHVQHV